MLTLLPDETLLTFELNRPRSFSVKINENGEEVEVSSGSDRCNLKSTISAFVENKSEDDDSELSFSRVKSHSYDEKSCIFEYITNLDSSFRRV